ncbi:MAG TPA: SsrA-binding protein SmpB [Chthoniobacteraceae bacterium]|nr:SsrA-binding protein SmpB [Chthoniobacteraceae bacterium]
MSREISVNRKALRDYHILDKLEAGIELRGTEVKSIRAGHCNINSAFARIENGQAWLYDVDIQPYDKASHEQHEPKRPRRLLLHRLELDKLFVRTQVKGLSLVALRLYWKDARVKVELGVGKGKEQRDQRADLKDRAVNRETDREVAAFNRRRG